MSQERVIVYGIRSSSRIIVDHSFVNKSVKLSFLMKIKGVYHHVVSGSCLCHYVM